MIRRLLYILCPFLLLLCGAPPGALESAAAACTLTTAYTVRDHLGRNYPVLASNRLKYNGKEQQDFASLSLPYLDYGARLYNPAILRWNAQDPLQEKYYGVSQFAYCADSPVMHIDTDGLVPRIYIQKGLLGHAFVTTYDGSGTVVYTYGRYGLLYPSSSGLTLGRLNFYGEGVLYTLKGKEAARYLRKVADKGNFNIFTINEASDEDTSKYFNDKFESGSRTKDKNSKAYDDENAKVVDEYDLLKNNCAIQTFHGINASKNILHEKKVRPNSLFRELNTMVEKGEDVVKENSNDFINQTIAVRRNFTIK